jgi:serine/threonine protein kinase
MGPSKSKNSQSIKLIYLRAMEIEDSEQQSLFLDEACRDDDSKRDRVDQLLAAADSDHDDLLIRALSEWNVDPDTDRLAATHISDLDQPVSDGFDSASFDFEQIGTQIGPYKLREQIGEGGMGVVYVAQQKQPVRRKVALKIIKPGMDTKQVVSRFESERQALAMMDHPNIARVFDGGSTESGRPYFVMELIHGLPITDYCDRMTMETHERLELFRSVCSAVQHAHQKGIIHRDLKPSNVLITEIDGRPVSKIIDFGIAKATSPQLTEHSVCTQFSQMIGTPLYMSPEQSGLQGVDIDTRSDVYSLGVILYELLSGETPISRDELQEAGLEELRRLIREVDPPRPSTRFSTLAAADSSTISAHRVSIRVD